MAGRATGTRLSRWWNSCRIRPALSRYSPQSSSSDSRTKLDTETEFPDGSAPSWSIDSHPAEDEQQWNWQNVWIEGTKTENDISQNVNKLRHELKHKNVNCLKEKRIGADFNEEQGNSTRKQCGNAQSNEENWRSREHVTDMEHLKRKKNGKKGIQCRRMQTHPWRNQSAKGKE